MNEAEFNSHLLTFSAAVVVPLITLIVTLWKLNKISEIKVQQPLVIDLKKEFVTKEEMRLHREEIIREQNKLEQRMTHLERKMESDKTEIIEAGEERVVKLHNRINDILAAFSELKGEIKGRFAKA